MITLFENYTEPLTEAEKETAIYLYMVLTYNPQTAKNLVNRLQKIVDNKAIKLKLNIRRIRKMVNYLRQNGFIVIATEKGYFITDDRLIIRKQILSLLERSGAIKTAANGLINSYNEKYKDDNFFKQPTWLFWGGGWNFGDKVTPEVVKYIESVEVTSEREAYILMLFITKVYPNYDIKSKNGTHEVVLNKTNKPGNTATILKAMLRNESLTKFLNHEQDKIKVIYQKK